MTTLHPSFRRLGAAIAAATTTLALFSAVVSISEPQRSELLARSRPASATMSASAPAPATAQAAAVRVADAAAAAEAQPRR